MLETQRCDAGTVRQLPRGFDVSCRFCTWSDQDRRVGAMAQSSIDRLATHIATYHKIERGLRWDWQMAT